MVFPILPGVIIANVGLRNESVVYVRDFDLRQVPVFIDGVPGLRALRWLRGYGDL